MAPVPGRGISLPNVTLGNKGSFWFASFNPYVTFYSIAIIWSFIAFTLSERWQAYKEFQMWFQWVRFLRVNPAPARAHAPLPPRAF